MEKIDNSVAGFLYSDDPLSEDATTYLINYKEEDDRVDLKLTLDTESEKEWLEITKDISAFANTVGGYLVFGFKDATKKIIGLDEGCARILSDVNNIRQKINRYLEPDIENIRSKKKIVKDQSIVILFIPQTIGSTHMISKDGAFKHQSGKSKVLLRKGTFYVRRTAGNHLGDPRDLDQILGNVQKLWQMIN